MEWNVKSGTGEGPGPNVWSAANTFVDADGDLHLTIANVGGVWYCAEISSTLTFGFGTFQWQVQSAVDQLDPNVVLGLFVYGPTALGPDGTHEFDIEYSRFGSTTGDNGWWTVFPNVQVTPPLLGQSHYPLVLGVDPTTTARFAWASTNVAFETMAGFQPAGSNASAIHSWTYRPADPSTTICQSPMPVHMNLWLYHGSPPTNGEGAEVVIHNFSFTPSSTGPPPVTAPALAGDGRYILAACLMGLGIIWSARALATSRVTRFIAPRRPPSEGP